MSNPISFEGRVTATQDETESAPATESAPENEQRFAAQTVHSFNFQIMIDRFGQHPPTLLVEEWENRTRYQVPRNRTFSEWHKAGRSRTRRQLTGASTLSFASAACPWSCADLNPEAEQGCGLAIYLDMQCGELDTMQLRDWSSLHIDIFPINQFKLLTFNNLAMACYGYGVFLLRSICYFQGTSTNGNNTHDSTRLCAGKEQIVSGLWTVIVQTYPQVNWHRCGKLRVRDFVFDMSGWFFHFVNVCRRGALPLWPTIGIPSTTFRAKI